MEASTYLRLAILEFAKAEGYQMPRPMDLYVEFVDAYMLSTDVDAILIFNNEGRGQKIRTIAVHDAIEDVMYGSFSHHLLERGYNGESAKRIHSKGGDYGKYYLLNKGLLEYWWDQCRNQL
jgi:hypothetical protein